MRHMLTVSLADSTPPVVSDAAARPPRLDDAPTLTHLMLNAYRGTTDDSGETLDDAIGEIAKVFDGAYGTFDFAASEVIERDGTIVAATMVTRFEDKPFIAFSMTAPAWKRRGLARAGLVRAMARLRAAEEQCLRLVVTEGNSPAQSLYASLGFVRE